MYKRRGFINSFLSAILTIFPPLPLSTKQLLSNIQKKHSFVSTSQEYTQVGSCLRELAHTPYYYVLLFDVIQLFLENNACLNHSALLGRPRLLANLFGLLHAMLGQRR